MKPARTPPHPQLSPPVKNETRSYPGGPFEAGNAFMAAELLAALVPSAKGDAKTLALRKVDVMKEKVLGSEPGLVVQLNRAAGDKLAIKATKVCVRACVRACLVFSWRCFSFLFFCWGLCVCRRPVFGVRSARAPGLVFLGDGGAVCGCLSQEGGWGSAACVS